MGNLSTLGYPGRDSFMILARRNGQDTAGREKGRTVGTVPEELESHPCPLKLPDHISRDTWTTGILAISSSLRNFEARDM